jgi:hypothetical protein
MGAPATAPSRVPSPRRAPVRRAPRSRPKAVPNPALAGAALLPHAAARTAGAIGDLSESSLIMRLTRGRGWIAVLCVLLSGIVTLNVLSLSLNATSGRVGQAVDQLERQNSGLRAKLAEKLSAGRVEAGAAELGLAVPAPEDVAYLTARDGDADKLAKLLEEGSPFISDTPEVSYAPPATSYEPSYEPPAPEEATPAPSESTPQPAVTPPATATAPPSTGGTTGGVGL